MSLPSSFSSLPNQEPHKYFKNLLIAFKKEIEGSADIDALQEKMQALINASKDMKYIDKHKKDVFHKSEASKTLSKVFSEFDRYITTIKKEPNKEKRFKHRRRRT